jgi:sugar lactone lactonase YvrE
VSDADVVVDGLVFPECPRWRPDGLWFSDQHDGKIYRVRPGQPAEVMVVVPGAPSGLGWLPDGTLMAVSMHDKALLHVTFRDGDTNNGRGGGDPDVEVVADLSPFHGGHSNDMVVDQHGRCYIGNIGYDIHGGEEARTTVLVMVASTAEGTFAAPRVVAEELMVPNGTVITPEGDRLIIAESMAHRLSSFRIAPDGSLDDRRVFADLGDETPDGICLDADGAIWFASVSRREVVRVEEGGRITQRVSTAPLRAIACMLGGPDRRDLFICATGSINPEKSRVLLQGAIEVYRAEVPGAGLP